MTVQNDSVALGYLSPPSPPRRVAPAHRARTR
jgi:hypothetical protein